MLQLRPANKGFPLATILLACYTVATCGSAWLWLAHTAGQGPCRLDDEGSWSIGVFKGASPFNLQPLERIEPVHHTSVAWPVANPVLTCASVGDSPSSFVADPFLYQHHSRLYMFYETKSVARQRGEIGVAISTNEGASFQHLGVALSEPWHLSYPFVFEYQGQVYMVPEGSASGELRLYRAAQFPLQWELDRVLVNRPLVDASLVEFGGRWWMFASDPRRFGARKNGELEVWYADSPLGPWEQHAANPVMNGAPSHGARNGGRPLVHEGRLYRFGQDCGETYGHKLVAYEVTSLTPTEFEQRRVDFSVGLPSWEASGSSSSSSSSRGRLSWDSSRRHHIDVQRLPSGEWVAAMDGDRVPSGAISSKLVRTAFLALGPWAALLLAWGGVRTALARRLLLTQPLYSMGSKHLPSILPISIMVMASAQHKRDDSFDLDSAFEEDEGKQVQERISPWWPTTWPRRLSSFAARRRLYQRVQQKADALLSPKSSNLRARQRHLRGRLGLGLAILTLLGGLCAAVGGGLYLRPYFAPYRAYSVGGQYSQFTLVSMSYSARMPTLRHMVRHYSRCPSVSEIVLVWNKGPPPVPKRDFDSAVPVRVRVEPENSLNNRFKIDPLIRTRAVLSLDDDIMMPCSDIERGFAAWRTQPEKMLGFYPRLIEGDPPVFRGERYSIERGQYNAVLTGAAFIDSWTAFPAYWADAVAPARAAVDEVFNGEDLLMNFVLANRTRHLAGRGQQGQGAEGAGEEPKAVQFIRPTRRVDISKLSGVGISHNFERFKKQATHYLANFTSTFGYVPLQHSAHNWEHSSPPFCSIDFLGCTYL